MSSARPSFDPTRRRLLRSTGLAGLGIATASLALLASCASPVGVGKPTATRRLRLIGSATLPHRLQFKGTTVGGLSGLDYDPVHDVWYALSDDRSDINPARFYTLRLPMAADRMGSPELLDMVTLTQADGQPFPGRHQSSTRAAGTTSADIPDPEAIRYRKASGTLLWSSEGDVRRGLSPSVREADLAGREHRSLELPLMFAIDPTGRTGPRDNLAFEGLTLTPDEAGAWVAMENALVQDGPEPTVEAPGGPCRITLFDLTTGRASGQRAYVPDPIPRATSPAGGYADNGISEILMQDAHRMLVLERAYITGFGNSLRLYRVDTRDGSDTLAVQDLRASSYTPMDKTLVADFADFATPAAPGQPSLPRLDNTEGMAWGPRLAGHEGGVGGRTLVFVSDDNFNPLQVTQFVAFEFLEAEA